MRVRPVVARIRPRRRGGFDGSASGGPWSHPAGGSSSRETGGGSTTWVMEPEPVSSGSHSLPGDQRSWTSTPFQNATWPRMRRANGVGRG